MQASHTATLWLVFILGCVLSHCGVVAGNKRSVGFCFCFCFFPSSSGFRNWCILRHAGPCSTEKWKRASEEAAVERLVSDVFQRDSLRCSELSFSPSVNLLPLHSWRIAVS